MWKVATFIDHVLPRPCMFLGRLLIDWSLNYCFVKLGLFLPFCFLSLKMCSMDDLFISTPTYLPHHGSRLESQMALPEFSFEHLSPQMVVFFQGAVEPLRRWGLCDRIVFLKMDFWRLHLSLILYLYCLLPALMWSLLWWAEIWNLPPPKKKNPIFLSLVLLSGILWQQRGKHCLWTIAGNTGTRSWRYCSASVSMFRCPGWRRTIVLWNVCLGSVCPLCADEGLRCRI